MQSPETNVLSFTSKKVYEVLKKYVVLNLRAFAFCMFSDEIVNLNHKKKITGKKYIFLAAISIKGIDDQSHKLKLSV